MINTYDPHIYIKTLSIVGIGGTGASVARIVGRILYDMKRNRQHTPDLILIDPDAVEEKNVGRQLFSPSVLEMNKAECVGKMLNLALGLDVKWIPEPVDPIRHFDRYSSNLVISCVDNHEARQAIHEVSGILIGSGNEHQFGQVCIGDYTDQEQMLRWLDGQDGKYSHLPKEGLLFPELLQPDATPIEPALSCAEQVSNGMQHLLINDWMATVVGGYVYKLLHRLPITTFLTFIDAETMVIHNKLINRDELAVYLCRNNS